MISFVGRRLLSILVVAVAIIFLGHLGMRMVNNSNVARPTYDWLSQSRAAWGQTQSFLRDALQGDFGSVSSRRGQIPVREILADTYFKSMGLLGAALIVAIVIGSTAGTLAALSEQEPFVLLFLTIIGISIPSFFAALLLQIAEIQWVRTFGFALVSVGGFGWDWKHMLLPTLVLAARPIAYLTRATFLALNQIMAEDYIRTAWAKGLGLPGVFGLHALPNVAIPALTAAGVSLRFSLSSLPIVEFFFGWPGLGGRLLSAIRSGQTQVVVTLALALGLPFIFVNLALDIVYRFIDPRL